MFDHIWHIKSYDNDKVKTYGLVIRGAVDEFSWKII